MEKSRFYSDAREDLSGPLAGMLVVEATTTWAGPMAGCVLADFGARVIKVEHPEGEITRRMPPLIPGTKRSVPYETVNRNKENVALDLRHAEGRDLFLKLCARADVLIENFRPGTMEKWGVGYEAVRAVKPDIVYVSISGFGQFGELSDRVGYDPLAQNYSGWASLNGDPEGGPTKAPTFLGDDLGGLHAALGALAALRHRDRTGEGQHIDISLVDALLFQSNGHPTAGALGLPLKRWGNQFGVAAPVNNYPCTDGNVFAGVLLDTHWKMLCRLIGREDLSALDLQARLGRREELDAVLGGWCAERSVAVVLEAFAELGLPATRVNTYEEVAREPHVYSRDMLQAVAMEGAGEVPLTGPAAKFSRTPTRVREPAASPGQDNAAVLADLGLDAAEIEALRARGALLDG